MPRQSAVGEAPSVCLVDLVNDAARDGQSKGAYANPQQHVFTGGGSGVTSAHGKPCPPVQLPAQQCDRRLGEDSGSVTDGPASPGVLVARRQDVRGGPHIGVVEGPGAKGCELCSAMAHAHMLT